MPTLDEILHAKDRVSGRLLQPDSSEIDAPESLGTLSRNFVGVGAGYRVKGGQIQNEMCLVVFVRIKLRPEYLGPYNVASYLKNEIGDFPVDVVETGSFRSLAASYPAGPMSQLVSGADVTMAGRATHGTVCAFALRKGEICLLSCGHVLDSCVNQFKLVVSRQQVVATVVQQADLLPGYGYGWPHQQDAVVAQLSAGVTPNFELPGALGQLSTDTPIPVHPGMAVIKAGKTVESGTVRYPHVKITVDYPSQTSILDNQILVRTDGGTFARAGDSGALVVARGHGHSHEQLWPVGMVIAAGDPVSLLGRNHQLPGPTHYAIVSPLHDVLKSVDAKLYAG